MLPFSSFKSFYSDNRLLWHAHKLFDHYDCFYDAKWSGIIFRGLELSLRTGSCQSRKVFFFCELDLFNDGGNDSSLHSSADVGLKCLSYILLFLLLLGHCFYNKFICSSSNWSVDRRDVKNSSDWYKMILFDIYLLYYIPIAKLIILSVDYYVISWCRFIFAMLWSY